MEVFPLQTWFSGVFPYQSSAITLVSGLLILWFDRPRMQRQDLEAEAALARILGWTYIVVGAAVWLIGTLQLGIAQWL